MMLASQRKLASTRRACTAPTAIAAGIGRRSAVNARSESTTKTVPSRTTCSALSHKSNTACLRFFSCGSKLMSRMVLR
ncbi:Uncharacterised protein [Vibrio cholerae]|nr:Uncharacterised protein [Vibrio cholerae]